MSYNSPSIGDLLIATLCSARSTRRFYAIIREREFKRYKKESVNVALSRLSKKGYLKNTNGNWSLTQKGILRNKEINLHSYIPSPFKENSTANTIISFDIPGPQRIVRDWLRNQIKIFGYKMLQQSLWLGPGPLPPEFLRRLEELKIRKNIKIFSIKKKEI
jgi:DNA-binding transcriptional regulator PaaX